MKRRRPTLVQSCAQVFGCFWLLGSCAVDCFCIAARVSRKKVANLCLRLEMNKWMSIGVNCSTIGAESMV